MADDVIDDLVKQGRHDEAAAHAVAEGRIDAAIAIYEKLWRFADGLPLALQLGQHARAVRLALEGRMYERALQIAASVPDSDSETLAAVTNALAGRGVFDEAGRTAERAGLLDRAVDLYRRAGLPNESARVLSRLGRLREAAELLELVIGRAAASTTAATGAALAEQATAELQLGRLLARLGRPVDAARILQQAGRHPSTTVDAHRTLCRVLLALGHASAANEIARRLASAVPDLPAGAAEIAALESDLPDPAERVPDRFAIDRLIGGGTTGRVYLAEDRLLGRPVALKALSVGGTHAEAEAMATFLREAEITGRLRHPHIVALLDVDTSAGLLVLEYLPGGSLKDALAERGRLPMASVRRLALELLDALAAAHSAGIVHRDVKPANIFLDAAGSAKLGDFGAAHLQDFGQTQTGGLIGTLAYLSPEQVTGARIGPEADLYALAATLFEALTGRPPFLGPDFVAQHLGEQAPHPSQLIPGLPGAVDQVLTRALAKAPGERFPSAAVMAAQIAGWPVEDAVTQMVSHASAGAVEIPGEEEVAPATDVIDRSGDVPLGATAHGQLVRRRDARVDRSVLVEIRDTPLPADEVLRVQREAAAGGPHVQRIIGLSADHREITYEAIDGTPLDSLADLSADTRTLIAETARRLDREPARVVEVTRCAILLIQPVVATST